MYGLVVRVKPEVAEPTDTDGGTAVNTYDPRYDERDPTFGTAPLPGTGPDFNPWNYRADSGWNTEFDLVGYHVEATDGRIGRFKK